MDARYSVRHSSVVEHGAQPYAPPNPPLYTSQIPSLQTYHPGFDQPLLTVSDHLFPSTFSSAGHSDHVLPLSFPSAGAARSFLAADHPPLSRTATAYPEIFSSAPTPPHRGVELPSLNHAYHAVEVPGLQNSYRTVEVAALNSSYRSVEVPPLSNSYKVITEPVPAGFRSAYTPVYSDVYDAATQAYVYQPKPQGQFGAPGSIVLSSEPLGRPMVLERDSGIGYIQASLLARRSEAEQRTRLERQRVLDDRRELKPKHSIETLSSPPARQSFLHGKKKTQIVNKVSKYAIPSNSEGLLASGSKESIWCSICQIKCNSVQMLQNHLDGKKHKARIEAQRMNTQVVEKKPEAGIKEPMKNNSQLKKGSENAMTKSKVKTMETKVKTKPSTGRPKEDVMKVETDVNAALSTVSKRNKRKKERKAERKKSMFAKQQEGKIEAADGTVEDAVSKALQEIEKIGADFTVEVINDVKTDKLFEDKHVEVDIVLKTDTFHKEIGGEGASVEDKAEDKQTVDQNIDGKGNLNAKDEVETDEITEQVNSTPDGGKVDSTKAEKEAESKKREAGTHAQSEIVRCEVCAVNCRNATVYESHLKNKKHAERLKQSLEGIKRTPARGRKVVGK